MRPAKNSPYGLLPPIQSGLLDAWTVPVRLFEATWTPFTYRISCEPVYVSATCVHVLTGSALVDVTKSKLPPNVPPPDGRPEPVSLLALSTYASVSRCMIVRQPLCALVG